MDNEFQPGQPVDPVTPEQPVETTVPPPSAVPPSMPPPTEIPSPGAQSPENEVKTLEEISGISPEAPPETTEVLSETPPKSKADTYSKLTRILVPVIVAVVLIAAGSLAYTFLIKGSSEEVAEPTEPEAEAETEMPAEPSGLFDESFNNKLEEALEEGIKSGETQPKEPVVEEEPATKPKIPTIKPKN